MDQPSDVIIVGGGLAGSSAAIRLAGLGHAVCLLEKDRMPRDKLCGEFLSTEVAGMCNDLGILETLVSSGARKIRRLRMTSTRSHLFETALPGTAFGISRRTLDHMLFERAAEVGAHTIEGFTVRSIRGNFEEGFRVAGDEWEVVGRVVLGAYGRGSALDRHLNRPVLGDRSPYVAFKAHFVGNELDDTIELHAFPGGYCGLLSEDHGEVNVCWITHRNVLKHSGGTPESMMEGVMRKNPTLARRFSSLERVGDFHASSQLVFRSQPLFADDVCMIGDAGGMIAPLCGDGMAMAMRSSELAAEVVDELLTGRCNATQLRETYVKAWRGRFRRRMRLGRWIHAGYVHPAVSELGIAAAMKLPDVARAVIRATRG